MSDMKSGGTIGLTTPKNQVHLLEWTRPVSSKAMKDNKCNQKYAAQLLRVRTRLDTGQATWVLN